jgi:Protein kinase domain
MNSGLSQADGLAALHDIVAGLIEMAVLSVLYRDLKPENVLRLEGRWQLADFGIARNLLQATATYTFRGAGTAPYIAPEIWNNQPATVQTDLYALGIVAYEVLTGARPFAGDEAALRNQHLYVAPTPTALPPAVGRLILRLLSKNPADRPQDARAVSEALEAALKTLSLSQQSLQQAALAAQQRQVTTEAEHAIGASAAQSAEARVRQALSELGEILAQAFDQVREALPEAEFREDGAQWHLTWNAARITVVPWRHRLSEMPFDQDPLVAGGEIFLGPGRANPAANVVCELDNGRLQWQLLRFTANPLVGSNYNFGPWWCPHGFTASVFRDQRPYMIQTLTHVWQIERSQLTPGSVVDLLHESITAV